jgi:ribosome-associated protein
MDMDEREPVTPNGIRLDPSCLSWRFSRASGPGGQHVNTSSTRVELICDLAAAGLPESLFTRLVEKLGTADVRVVVMTERSQIRNRQRALERLGERLDEAAVVERQRRATRPSRGAKERRLEAKRQTSGRKADRRWQPD